jgi:hypothetical protein
MSSDCAILFEKRAMSVVARLASRDNSSSRQAGEEFSEEGPMISLGMAYMLTIAVARASAAGDNHGLSRPVAVETTRVEVHLSSRGLVWFTGYGFSVDIWP